MCGAELKTLPEGVQRVAALLQASGHAHAPVMLDEAARTAQGVRRARRPRRPRPGCSLR
jgi:hypothetical protein